MTSAAVREALLVLADGTTFEGELKRDEIIREKEFLVGDKRLLRAPYFDIQGHVVWGATAMILSELLYLVKKM